MRTKEVRAVLVTDFDDFLDLVLQLLGVLSLLLEFLGLEQLVEGWDNLSIDLLCISMTYKKSTRILT